MLSAETFNYEAFRLLPSSILFLLSGVPSQLGCFEAAYFRAFGRSVNCFFSFPVFGSSGSTARGAHYRGGPDGVNNFVAVFLPDLHEGKLPLADLAHNIATLRQYEPPIFQTLPIQPHGTLFDHPDTLGGAGD